MFLYLINLCLFDVFMCNANLSVIHLNAKISEAYTGTGGAARGVHQVKREKGERIADWTRRVCAASGCK